MIIEIITGRRLTKVARLAAAACLGEFAHMALIIAPAFGVARHACWICRIMICTWRVVYCARSRSNSGDMATLVDDRREQIVPIADVIRQCVSGY